MSEPCDVISVGVSHVTLSIAVQYEHEPYRTNGAHYEAITYHVNYN